MEQNNELLLKREIQILTFKVGQKQLLIENLIEENNMLRQQVKATEKPVVPAIEKKEVKTGELKEVQIKKGDKE